MTNAIIRKIQNIRKNKTFKAIPTGFKRSQDIWFLLLRGMFPEKTKSELENEANDMASVEMEPLID